MVHIKLRFVRFLVLNFVEFINTINDFLILAFLCIRMLFLFSNKSLIKKQQQPQQQFQQQSFSPPQNQQYSQSQAYASLMPSNNRANQSQVFGQAPPPNRF